MNALALVAFGVFVLAGLAAAYIGLAIIRRTRNSVRIADISGEIVRPTRTAEIDPAPPSPTQGAELLQSAHVEDHSLGLLAKLPPFAPVAIRLLRLLDNAEAQPSEVASLIAADPALRTQLLGIANSWLFAVRVPIDEPLKAITLIGMDQTRALALTWAARSLHANAPRSAIVRRLWRHSLATGIVAEALADAYGLKSTDANSAGTLHDIGRIALLAAHGKTYEKLLLRTHDSVEQMLSDEKLQFGLNHCEAGCVLIQSLGLSDELSQAASDHHQPSNGHGLNALIYLSCKLATSLGFPTVAQAERHNPDETISLDAPAELQSTIQQRVSGLLEHLDQAMERFDF